MRNLIKICLSVFVSILVVSCNKKRLEIEYFENGTVKIENYYLNDEKQKTIVFNKDGLVQRVMYFNDEKIVDTIFGYSSDKRIRSYLTQNSISHSLYEKVDEKGNIIEKGNLFNGSRVGWWCYYNELGIKTEERYFVLKTGENEYSQHIRYSPDGKVNELESNYVKFLVSDTLYLGKSTGTLIFKKILKYGTDTNICIGYNLKPDYSNITDSKVDTFYSANNDGFFGVDFKVLGKQTIRGFVYEIDMKKTNDTTLSIQEAERCFEKTFFIIPRPDSIPKDKVMHYHIKK
ncbi:hypothetical protein [Flavobacterium sp. NKUCC04_CG]|uniref:hypothetical protein n=1 Tax=Flavobacterium sp. NKUCC04_CG TaxID=2842121 RepID=UPI001C5BE086|nr:hypothetical protein [Flavobacterium sp. NKUCC04_CG]MBW3519876.1 hypothetical protein [Flavobacterium sp. NKUCC04_CG]